MFNATHCCHFGLLWVLLCTEYVVSTSLLLDAPFLFRLELAVTCPQSVCPIDPAEVYAHAQKRKDGAPGAKLIRLKRAEALRHSRASEVAKFKARRLADRRRRKSIGLAHDDIRRPEWRENTAHNHKKVGEERAELVVKLQLADVLRDEPELLHRVGDFPHYCRHRRGLRSNAQIETRPSVEAAGDVVPREDRWLVRPSVQATGYPHCDGVHGEVTQRDQQRELQHLQGEQRGMLAKDTVCSLQSATYPLPWL